MNPIWTPITPRQYATILTDQRMKYTCHITAAGPWEQHDERQGVIIAYTPTKALVQPI